MGNGLMFLWLLVFVAAALLGSTLANSTSAAAGIGLVMAVLLLVLGSIPPLASFAPSGLIAWASQLGLAGGTVTAYPSALAANIVWVLLLLLTGVALFETQEL
jgi:hypothetical protein